MQRALVRIAIALVVAACAAEAPTTTAGTQAIDTRQHYGVEAGVYFYPPLAHATPFIGAFDGEQRPIVEIHESAGSWFTRLATYTMDDGPHGGRVQVDPATERYRVTWATQNWTLDPAKLYRISIYVRKNMGTRFVAFVDLQISGTDVLNLWTGQTFALDADMNLPIEFWLGACATCGRFDACSYGVCEADGTCSLHAVPDGSACNDDNACTAGESCQAGVCAGQTVECATDRFNQNCGEPGVCDPMTGCPGYSYPTSSLWCGDVPDGTMHCARNACTDLRCDVGRGNCNANIDDGCETELVSTAHCGRCGNSCPAPRANGSATCKPSAEGYFGCAYTCDPGYVVEGDTCMPLPPRPIKPLSFGTTTSQRPTFRWLQAPTTAFTHLDLCRDRELKVQCARVDSTGAGWVPPAALAPGRWFWRMYGTDANGRSTAFSPVWQLNVASRTTATDTANHSQLDINNDGYADLVVGASTAPGGGAAYVFLGGAAGLGATSQTLRRTNQFQFGSLPYELGKSLASGDTDGDGFDDVLVGESHGYRNTLDYRSVYVYRGGAQGLGPPQSLFPEPTGYEEPTSYVAPLGDVNGDGYADVVLGSVWEYEGNRSYRAQMHHGGPLGLQWHDYINGSASFYPLGDVNADGYADVALVGLVDRRYHVFVHHGGSTGLSKTPAFSYDPQAATLAVAGSDVNGDGYADLVLAVGTAEQTQLRIFAGGSKGLDATLPPVLTTIPSFTAMRFAGDLNRDGYADLAVGTDTGAAIYAGNNTAKLVKIATAATSGRAPHGVGDVNKDGLPDLAVCCQQGGVGIFHGTGKLGSVMFALVSTLRGETTTENFGSTIAGIW